jgi:predicted Zn-dependent protease
MMRWLVLSGCVAALVLGLGCMSQQPSARSASSLLIEGDGGALHRVARRLAVQGDLVRAEQYAMLAVQRGLPIAQVLPLLLEVCLRASRVSAALHHAEPVLRRRPDDQRLRYVVASLYVALNRREDAERELALLLRADPDHHAASLLLAQIREAP